MEVEKTVALGGFGGFSVRAAANGRRERLRVCGALRTVGSTEYIVMFSFETGVGGPERPSEESLDGQMIITSPSLTSTEETSRIQI